MPTRGARAVAAPAEANAKAALATAVLLYVLVVVLELGAPERAHIPSMLVAVPAVVALAFRPLAIIAAALVMIATRWAFLLLEPGRLGAAIGTTASIAAIAAAACFVVRRRAHREAVLSEVVSVAEAAQHALLRTLPASVGDLRAVVSYRAAAQFARIGGDVYALTDTAFGVRAVVGDVRGSGLGAVGTAAVVIGSFHEAAYEQEDLERLADRLDLSLARHLGDDEAFVTALMVEIGPDGRLRALSCGHPPPLVLRPGSAVEVPVPAGLPLGLRHLVPMPAVIADCRLRPGDTLLLYTDGLSEARDADGTFYPLVARLGDRLRAASAPVDPATVVEWLQEDAQRHAGGRRQDDSAILALTWTPPDPS